MLISPAKINIGLKVLFKYPNNYHHIVSMFAPINLSDNITITTANSFKLTWEPQLPPYFLPLMAPFFDGDKIEKNIIVQSHKWFIQWIQKKEIYNIIGDINSTLMEQIKNIHIHIKKKIPSPSGLGGGSSNAASTLLYLLSIVCNFKNIHIDILLNILKKDALALGSDIPFFLQKKPAIISGIGEVEENIELPKLFGILGVPTLNFPTNIIYNFSNSSLQTEVDYQSIINNSLLYFHTIRDELQGMNKLSNSSVFEVENDLWLYSKKAFNKDALKIRDTYLSVAFHCCKKLDDIDTLYCSMSGSGSSFYVLSRSSNILNVIPEINVMFSDVSWFLFSI